QSIYKRGRLPDMVAVRVIITASVAFAIVLFVVFVPVPINRVRGLALVQTRPEASSQVQLRRSAILMELNCQPGDKVTRGQVLARFRDPDLEDRISSFKTQRDIASQKVRALQPQLEKANSQGHQEEASKIHTELTESEKDRETAEGLLKAAEQT